MSNIWSGITAIYLTSVIATVPHKICKYEEFLDKCDWFHFFRVLYFVNKWAVFALKWVLYLSLVYIALFETAWEKASKLDEFLNLGKLIHFKAVIKTQP